MDLDVVQSSNYPNQRRYPHGSVLAERIARRTHASVDDWAATSTPWADIGRCHHGNAAIFHAEAIRDPTTTG
jgi:hypothetical protein